MTARGNNMANGKFITLNISDYLENKIGRFSEANLDRIISNFSSIDPYVEAFLKGHAKEFARQHKSVTYIVFSSRMAELLGYFTLAAKPITLELGKMSKTMERAVKKTGNLDESMNTYTTSAFLVAQLSRNFSPSLKSSISGDELLDVALKRLKGIQRNIGGTIVFLETQNNEKLLSFYQGNGFKALGKRTASYKDGGNYELIRMVKVL